MFAPLNSLHRSRTAVTTTTNFKSSKFKQYGDMASSTRWKQSDLTINFREPLLNKNQLQDVYWRYSDISFSLDNQLINGSFKLKCVVFVLFPGLQLIWHWQSQSDSICLILMQILLHSSKWTWWLETDSNSAVSFLW